MTTTTNEAHPFERAGLGKAPFRCIGFSVEKYQACPGAPVQVGTCCDYCYTGICNVFRIRSADGKVFKVGCDCVAKTDPGLYAEVKEARKAYLRSLREAAYAEGRAARREAWAAEKRRTAERNETALAMVLEGLRLACDSANVTGYDRRVCETALRELEGGDRSNLTDKEWDVLGLAYLASLLPTSKHAGKEGERIRGLRVRFEGGPLINLDSPYGSQILGRFRVLEGPYAGAVLVWKTGSIRTKTYDFVGPGWEGLLTGTVKSHSEYQGVPQSWVSRCALTGEA